jgi:hypothetical protein
MLKFLDIKKGYNFSKTEIVEAEVPSHQGEGCSDHQSAKERVTSYGKLQDTKQRKNITKIPVQNTKRFKALFQRILGCCNRTGPPVAQ